MGSVHAYRQKKRQPDRSMATHTQHRRTQGSPGFQKKFKKKFKKRPKSGKKKKTGWFPKAIKIITGLPSSQNKKKSEMSWVRNQINKKVTFGAIKMTSKSKCKIPCSSVTNSRYNPFWGPTHPHKYYGILVCPMGVGHFWAQIPQNLTDWWPKPKKKKTCFFVVWKKRVSPKVVFYFDCTSSVNEKKAP